MKMNEITIRQRPREKMIENGSASLSNVELLAVLLRTGIPGQNVLSLAFSVLEETGQSLTELFSLSIEQLSDFKGIGKCKAAEIQAAFELGRRFYDEKVALSGMKITSSKAVYEHLRPKFKGLKKEECWAVFLSSAGKILGKKRLTLGSSDCTLVDNQEVLKSAIEKRASGVILAHNHPSGNPLPSSEDVKSTESLRDACRAVDISLLDHLIITDNSYFSFSDEK